jgi:hypothetical protein
VKDAQSQTGIGRGAHLLEAIIVMNDNRALRGLQEYLCEVAALTTCI